MDNEPIAGTEGLPKALVEAMGRGLPCIGTKVGGIPELLPEEDLVAPNDPEALSTRMLEVLADPERRTYMSARNVRRAGEYRCDLLRQRRIAFYQALRRQTEMWLKVRSMPELLSTDRA
jgi:glycosyltransferase involved in cell wall biosynthesis